MPISYVFFPRRSIYERHVTPKQEALTRRRLHINWMWNIQIAWRLLAQWTQGKVAVLQPHRWDAQRAGFVFDVILQRGCESSILLCWCAMKNRWASRRARAKKVNIVPRIADQILEFHHIYFIQFGLILTLTVQENSAIKGLMNFNWFIGYRRHELININDRARALADSLSIWSNRFSDCAHNWTVWYVTTFFVVYWLTNSNWNKNRNSENKIQNCKIQ